VNFFLFSEKICKKLLTFSRQCTTLGFKRVASLIKKKLGIEKMETLQEKINKYKKTPTEADLKLKKAKLRAEQKAISDIQISAHVTYPSFKIETETEKAIFIACTATVGREIVKNGFWAPKSQIKIENETVLVATWFLDKKIDEMASQYAYRAFLGLN
jgi:hypothetical protein